MQMLPSSPAPTRGAVLVEHLHVVAGHRDGRRPGLDRHRLEPARVRRDRPTRLGLPPVVDDRDAEDVAGPVVGVRVEPLTGEEQGGERGEVVPGAQRRGRILLLDGAECRRRGEQRLHVVVGDDPPEGPGVRSADRLALVEHGRRSDDQRRVDDVGVADDPADVAGRPEDLARADAVDVLHGPRERDGVTAVVAHDALGLAGRPGGVEHVERVGRVDGHALRGLRARDEVVPVDVHLSHRCDALRTLQHDRRRWLVRRELERAVEHRLVLDDAAGLDAAGRRHDDLRRRVVDADRKLVRREAAEHHRVHGTEPRGREHRDHRLRDHRHVEDHPVTRADPETAQSTREGGDLVAQPGVRERLDRARDGAVVDQRRAVAVARPPRGGRARSSRC